ncbi:putative ribonuclease H-like domain-containing protein [Tanacetum coccineum]
MVNTARDKNFNTTMPKAVVNVVKGNNFNAVNASACWVWKLKHKVLDHVSKHNSASITLKKFDYIDAQGISKEHVLSYKTMRDSRGYICFWRNPKGGETNSTGKDHLGKFDSKADEGFFVGYSLNSKAFRVFNSRTRIVEENLHIRFSESTPNVVGSGPDWLFNIDALTRTMNYEPIVANPKSSHDDGSKPSSDDRKKVNAVDGKTSIELPFDPNMPVLKDYSIFDFTRDDEDDAAVADMNNLDTTIQVSPILTIRILKDHPLDQEEPKKVIHALKDPSWIEAMQEELLQFKLQKVWTLVDLPNGKKVIGSKWIFRNKKDERGIVIRNKARLVAQGYTQEEWIDYDEVFAPVARIEEIRLFLAYVSFKDFVVYQMDVKSAFIYGKIEEEGISVGQWVSKREIDKTLFIKRHKGDILLVQVYVDDIIFGSTKKELCNAFEKLLHKKFQMSSMGELTFFLGLQVQQKKDGIFISQDKYVAEILKKFRFTEVNTASTPMKTQKPLLKDEDGEEVDVHMYRYQVNPKVLHLFAVKRIFRYLKGQPKLGLWYSKDSPFDLVAYTDSDYAGASLDRKSTTGGY